jgi:triacylglycerol lipase
MSFLVELPFELYDPHAFAEFSPDANFARNALAMSWMSQLAYETRVPAKIHNVGKKWSLSEIAVIRQPSKSTLPMSATRAVAANRDGATIIAFAGTDPLNLLNWVSDFYLGHPKADVHEGFLDAAASVWPEISVLVQHASQHGRRLFLTGHSLGAAIALLIADHAAREKGLESAEIFVYGAPRVGRADFVARYNAKFGPTTYRFVHGRDIVPTVPPVELGFHHVGRYLSCRSGDKFDLTLMGSLSGTDEPLIGQDFFTGVAARLQDLVGSPSRASRLDTLGRLTEVLAPSIGDHLPDRYYGALSNSP